MRRLALPATLFAVLLLAFSAIAEDGALDAEAVLDRVNSAWRGDSFHGIVRLEISLGGATKRHALEVWTLGEDLALIRVLEPEIDLNSGYLQQADELWYYSPAVGPIKLPAMAIGDALFGSGPSLDDLSHGTLSDDYDASVDVIEDGFFLTLIPHLDAPVVYGRLEIRVTADYVMERLTYYDQRGDVLQTAFFSDVVETGDRKFATTIVIEDRFGDRTLQQIELAEFDIELEAGFFSLDTFGTWGEDP
ncbi:MAG: outer membrane lipoprotein-sorting protein [Candidatus Bipolaricaulota bacterium]|nr:MAG: outer membrane lipoprotein-sorting protein [Candidatus Bipolaricaulota bacterium]